MKKWKTYLKDDPTEWLLEESNPSVRYFTLRWILDKSEDDKEVIRATEAIAKSPSVEKILKRQKPEGYWGSDPRPHHGTRGFMLLLVWMGYRGNESINKAMEYRLKGCIQDDGAYAVEIKGGKAFLPCHAADLLRQMFWFGYEDDPRAGKVLNWLISIQQPDGCWPCVSKKVPFNCNWATAGVLRAYRDLPEGMYSPKVEESKKRAVELFLNSDMHGPGKPSERWYQFGFPLQWDTDVLEMLSILAPHIDAGDKRIEKELNLVLKKQDDDGRWPCEKHPKGGRWMQKFVEFEELGQPSKWVTLYAMTMLKTLFGE
jgi:hypothetical protein